MVAEMTGSAKASPDNTSGLVLKIPADAKYLGESVSTVAKKKKQDLGDKTKTPQQYTNKGVKGTFQEGIDQTIREMKDKNVFEGRKSQLKTKLGALNLYDDSANNTVWINRDRDDSDSTGYRRSVSNITVMEIAT